MSLSASSNLVLGIITFTVVTFGNTNKKQGVFLQDPRLVILMLILLITGLVVRLSYKVTQGKGHSMSDQLLFCNDHLRFAFKFGMFVGIYCTIHHAHFQRCKSSGFRHMILTNVGERSYSPPTPYAL